MTAIAAPDTVRTPSEQLVAALAAHGWRYIGTSENRATVEHPTTADTMTLFASWDNPGRIICVMVNGEPKLIRRAIEFVTGGSGG